MRSKATCRLAKIVLLAFLCPAPVWAWFPATVSATGTGIGHVQPWPAADGIGRTALSPCLCGGPANSQPAAPHPPSVGQRDIAAELLSVPPLVGGPHLSVRLDRPDARHLLRRSGLGANPAEVDELVGLTRAEAIDLMVRRAAQTAPITPLPPAFDGSLSIPPYWLRWDLKQDDRRAFAAARDRDMADLAQWWVVQMIETPTPQAERLVLVLSNHFTTGYSGIDEEAHALFAQHMLLRDHATGNLRDLLRAILRDAAMLNYLDNNSSTRAAPNENLARELMELFVLGEGNYSNDDVREVARALTGNRYSRLRGFDFDFAGWNHDPTDKTILGRTGPFDGDDVIDILLDQPAAALWFARRYWRAYISEFDVDDDDLNRIADAFRTSEYDLGVLYRETLASPAFWDRSHRDSIVKSPVDLIIGTIRTTGQVPEGWQTLPATLSSLGQTLFDPPNVAGWPGGMAWVTPSRILQRESALTELAARLSVAPDDALARAEPDANHIMIRYAADRFKGDPEFTVSVASEAGESWTSPVIRARSGLGASSMPGSDSRMRAWQIARIPAPVMTNPVAVQVTYLNDMSEAAPLGGDIDRNLYIDWVGVGDGLWTAAAGQQDTACGPDYTEIPGQLYCNGTLQLSPPRSDPDLTEADQGGLIVDRVTFEWSAAPRSQSWSTFTIGLLGPRLNSLSAEAMRLSLVLDSSQTSERLLLQIPPQSCSPDCFGLPTNAETFVLAGPEASWESETWAALSKQQQYTIAGLVAALPDLIHLSSQGQNWSDRGGATAYRDWYAEIDRLSDLPPGNRYATMTTRSDVIARPRAFAVPSQPFLPSRPTTPGRESGVSLTAFLAPTFNLR